jgi:hypothetical protein
MARPRRRITAQGTPCGFSIEAWDSPSPLIRAWTTLESSSVRPGQSLLPSTDTDAALSAARSPSLIDASSLHYGPINGSDANCAVRDCLGGQVDRFLARNRIYDSDPVSGCDEGLVTPAVKGDPNSLSARFHHSFEGTAMVVEHDVIDGHLAPPE